MRNAQRKGGAQGVEGIDWTWPSAVATKNGEKKEKLLCQGRRRRRRPAFNEHREKFGGIYVKRPAGGKSKTKVGSEEEETVGSAEVAGGEKAGGP